LAACQDLDLGGDPYFPEDEGQPPVAALGLCARCPVAIECLATAMLLEAGDGYRVGWWGGLSPNDRENLWESIGVAETHSPEAPDVGKPAAVARWLRDQGQTVPQIAARLGCSERTVYRYLKASAA
jgi:hypothetical protein